MAMNMWARPQVWKSGAAMWVRQPDFRGNRDMSETLAGPEGVHVPVRGIASGTYHHTKLDRIGRYRIFEIANGRITADHVRVWDRERGCFEREPEPGVDRHPAAI